MEQNSNPSPEVLRNSRYQSSSPPPLRQ